MYETKPSHSPQFFELYKMRMNSSLEDKLHHILPYMPEELNELSRIISIGAGTGKLEAALMHIYPAHIFALDSSLKMIESIDGETNRLETNGAHKGDLFPIRADARDIPFADNSFNVAIASSVFHEIISFGDGYMPEKNTRHVFQEIARTLKRGGRVLIRDFMLPEYADEPIDFEVGSSQTPDDLDPVTFLQRFVSEYKGVDIPTFKMLTAEHPIEKGIKYQIPLSEALELAVHYSWSQRFDDEVKEQYFHFSPTSYVTFIAECFKEQHASSNTITSYTYLQDGYPNHINGRLNLYHLNGNPCPIPPFTGIIAIEKQGITAGCLLPSE
jgi:ubiquinone/menaquinone biosynthesis C-methylase UbiE